MNRSICKKKSHPREHGMVKSIDPPLKGERAQHLEESKVLA